MAEHWWSIEVCDGRFSAAQWRRAHSEALIEAALTHGGRRWHWVDQPWGLVLEIAFKEPSDWARFRMLAGVTAALDAVPDPVYGLYIYVGRGGSSSAPDRVRPRPRAGAGGAALPVTREPLLVAKLAS